MHIAGVNYNEAQRRDPSPGEIARIPEVCHNYGPSGELGAA